MIFWNIAARLTWASTMSQKSNDGRLAIRPGQLEAVRLWGFLSNLWSWRCLDLGWCEPGVELLHSGHLGSNVKIRWYQVG